MRQPRPSPHLVRNLKHKVQLRLMGTALVSLVFGLKLKHWTKSEFDLMVALDRNSGGITSISRFYPLVAKNVGAKAHVNPSDSC